MMFDESSGKFDNSLRGDPESDDLAPSPQASREEDNFGIKLRPAIIEISNVIRSKDDSSLSKSWRTHENASRVKLWMDSHERFAMTAEYLVGLVAPQKPFGKPELDAFVKAFDESVWAIEKHSDFEEKKIFPYFQEKAELNLKLQAKELHHEHTHWRESVEKIRKVLKAEDATKEQKRLHAALIEYEAELKQHMREEEDAILKHWLEMSTWDYALFFGSVFIKMITSPFE